MKTSQWVPIVLFVLIVATLLVGQRFGFVWAGGDGYRPQRIATTDGSDVTYHRGKTVATGPNERSRLIVGSQSIALDENTTIILSDLRDESLVVRLVRGRIYIDGPGTVQTNFTSTTTDSGALTVVNYDFLETVSIAPFYTTVPPSGGIPPTAVTTVTTKGSLPIEIQKPVSIHETPPVSIAEIPFDVTAASVAEFYRWAMR